MRKLCESSFTTAFAINSTKYSINKATNLQTLQPLIASKVIIKGLGDKIAGSGLMMSHLQHSFSRGGKDGLKSVLTEIISGKARVKTSSRIITQLCNYFTNTPT